jgi:hypothetical protein
MHTEAGPQKASETFVIFAIFCAILRLPVDEPSPIFL